MASMTVTESPTPCDANDVIVRKATMSDIETPTTTEDVERAEEILEITIIEEDIEEPVAG